MAYIGNSQQNQSFVPAVDYFSGNGSTVAFTLSKPVASVAAIEAVVANVVQNPSTAFSVNGNTITFTSAPPVGTNNVYVRYTSPNTQVVQPGYGTVYPSSLSTGGPSWNTNGNIALSGSTTAAWASGRKSVDSDNASVFFNADNAGAFLCNNCYYDGTNWRYITTGAASIVGNGGGSPTMSVAASGTAGSIITFTTAMSGSTTGILRFPSQPAWAAEFDGFTCTNAAQVYYPTYARVKFNVSGGFNSSTGKFTAPATGTYLLTASYLRNSNALVFRGRFYRNGTTVGDGELRTTEAVTGFNESCSHVQIVSATAGDWLAFGIACDAAGGSIYSSGYNFFHGVFLG